MSMTWDTPIQRSTNWIKMKYFYHDKAAADWGDHTTIKCFRKATKGRMKTMKDNMKYSNQYQFHVKRFSGSQPNSSNNTTTMPKRPITELACDLSFVSKKKRSSLNFAKKRRAKCAKASGATTRDL